MESDSSARGDYPLGKEVKFRDIVRDVRSDADVTVRAGIVNGLGFQHDGARLVSVYVPKDDRTILVHESNILTD